MQHKTNVVINLRNVAHIEEKLINELAALQQQFYALNISFVICQLQLPVQVGSR